MSNPLDNLMLDRLAHWQKIIKSVVPDDNSTPHPLICKVKLIGKPAV